MTREQTTNHGSKSSNSKQSGGSQLNNTQQHHIHHHHHHSGHHQSSIGNQKLNVPFEPFFLLSPDDKSLKQAAEYVENASLNRFKVCVVSIIGKGAFDDSTKDQLIKSLLSNNSSSNRRRPSKRERAHKHNKWQSSSTSQAAQEPKVLDETENGQELKPDEELLRDECCDYENQVVGNVDCKAGLIFLNLTSFLETDKLSLLSEKFGYDPIDQNQVADNVEQTNSSSWLLDVWPHWNQNVCKTILLLLIMSNIVIFYNPEPSLDCSLIQKFKILEILRMKSRTRITDLLETIASKQMFPQQWIRQGRLGCPRALFVFGATHLDAGLSQTYTSELKRDLEDQIYKLLKKTNIISRLSGSSSLQSNLFYLPEREDFVFIIRRPYSKPRTSSGTGCDTDPVGSSNIRDDGDEFYSRLFKSLAIHIERGAESKASEQREDEELLLDELLSDTGNNNPQVGRTISVKSSCSSFVPQSRFKKFLGKHINDIQSLSQLDQENKPQNTNGSPVKQLQNVLLPRYDDFFNVLLRLKNLLFPMTAQNELESIKSNAIDWKNPDERRFIDIYDQFNTDELFSKLHCYKMRLAAYDFFTRALQVPLSNQATYENSLESAKKLYLNHARGSACSLNLNQLMKQCDHYWNSITKSKSLEDGTTRNIKTARILRTKSSDAPPTSSGDPTSYTFLKSSMASHENRPQKSNLTILRRSNGIKMMTSCECGRQSHFMITPVDRKKKLERIDVHRISD